MIYRRQRILHNPDKGLYGDCHRTALACILNMEPESVPNFAQLSKYNSDKFYKLEKEWLHTKGLDMIHAKMLGDLTHVMKCAENWLPDTYYILGGNVEKGIESSHSVVCINDEFKWDPHPASRWISYPYVDTGDGTEFFIISFITSIIAYKGVDHA